MKTLKTIAEGFIIKTNVSADTEIFGITVNSQRVEFGFAFFAMKDNAFALDAIKKGAAVVVTEKFDPSFPCVQVKDIRRVVALACKEFYDDPARDMCVIGVVGTNGKTSTTHIISHILKKSGRKTCLIGTLGCDLDGQKIAGTLTTPDPDDLWALLAEAKKAGVKYIVMEISAHAIHFEKLYGLNVSICVFTNLSRDHLDFFGDMETYKNVKLSFFTEDKVKLAVANSDDETGRAILNGGKVCAIGYGLRQPADVFAIDVEYFPHGTKFVLNALDEIVDIFSPLLGEFNVYNVLAAAAAAKATGLGGKTIKSALVTLPPIEGRFNVIQGDKTVIIDYAHTPDGLEKILRSVAAFAKKRIIAVFGCGGNRDKLKRPIMGRIASENADVVIVTSDNPRFEKPDDIIEEVSLGCKKGCKLTKITDREEAIRYALSIAEDGDVIVIAGKGGENYLDIQGVKYPYSDKEIVEKYNK